MGTECALLSGKKFCKERTRELFPAPWGAPAASLTLGVLCDGLHLEGNLLCSSKLAVTSPLEPPQVFGCKMRA